MVIDLLAHKGSLIALVLLYGAIGVGLGLWLIRLSRGPRPGIVDIAFADDSAAVTAGAETSQSDRRSTTDLFAALRQALTSVNLQAPSTLPGESAPQDFLTDVRSTAQRGDSSLINLAVFALTSLFSARPDHHVSVTRREGERGPALTLQISHRHSRDTRVVTASGDDWDEVVAKAASHVAAAILPRTRVARVAPWTPWRGRIIEGELFYHFQEGRRRAAEQRYEEALTHFEAALKFDPLNPYIRIERAAVMDQIGLYIDALATYVDIVHIESNYDRRLRRRLSTSFPTRSAAGEKLSRGRLGNSPNGLDALQIARFRMVAALASSSRLSEQWWRRAAGAARTDPTRDQRQIEASSVIEKLHPLLHTYATSLANFYGTDSATLPLLRRPGRQLQKNLPILRRVLQFAALYEAEMLERDYRRGNGRRRLTALPVSQSVLRILPAWAAVQYRYVEAVQSRGSAPPGTMRERVPSELSICPKLMNTTMKRYERTLKHRWWELGRWTYVPDRSALTTHTWPPPPDGMARLVRRAFRGRPARLVGWQEHYSAACLFAVGMLTSELEQAPSVDQAIDHVALIQFSLVSLEHSVISPNSTLADAASPWLNMGDQNFDDLRYTARYRTFVSRFFPGASAATRLPVNVALLTMSRHTTNLVQQFADTQFQRLNRLRNDGWTLTAHELRVEVEAWETLAAYCLSYRDWRARNDLIRLGLHLDRHNFSPAVRGLDVDLDEALSGLLNDVDRSTDRRTIDEFDQRAVDWRERELARTLNWLKRSAAIQKLGRESIVGGRDVALKLIRTSIVEPPVVHASLGALWEANRLHRLPVDDLLSQLLLAWQELSRFLAKPPDPTLQTTPLLTDLRDFLSELA